METVLFIEDGLDLTIHWMREHIASYKNGVYTVSDPCRRSYWQEEKRRRLMPYTTVLPKPLMPIGDYPILEVILRQQKQ